MLSSCNLQTLEERRKNNRLVYFYKVVEGKIPAIPPEKFLTVERPKRQIKAKKFEDYVSDNLVEKFTANHDRAYKYKQCNTKQLENSFFVRTVLDWNNLDSASVHADSVEAFKTSLSRAY